MRSMNPKRLLVSMLVLCPLMSATWAQTPPRPAQQAAITIDIKNALERARLNSPQLQSASLGVELAQQERYLAKTLFYPTVSYSNQYIYTQGNGTPSGVFVSNDGVHVYNSQGIVHQELFTPSRMAEYRRSIAAAALAAVKKEVAANGIAAAVFQNYYGVVTAQRHLANAQQAVEEAREFAGITAKLERGGEVARADVVKAQLTLQQRERDVQEALLSVEKTKVSLALLLFPDYTADFNLVDDLGTILPLASLDQMLALGKEKNPDLKAAEQSLRQEEYGVAIARSGYLPSLNLDYYYGINANRFAVNDEEGHRRLGSVAQATLNIPVFNWWATRSKVRQADLRRQQAQLDLTLTQRQLVANLRSSHMEAQAALAQVDSLKKSMDLSAESLRLTHMRYEAGEATVLEVVDAQSTLAQARNAYDDGLSRYRLALANLQTLTGNY